MKPTPPTHGSPLPYSPGRLESLLLRLGTVGELLALFLRGKRWWMLPLVGLLLALGLVLVLLQSVQYVAPFIYMVF
jgi:hypothetical protein